MADPEAPPVAPTPLASLAAWGFLAVATGLLATGLWVVRNSLLPEQRPLTFALAFLPWQVAFFVASFLLAGLVAVVLGRTLGRPALPHLLMRGLAGAVTLLVVFSHGSWLVPSLVQLGGPPRHRVLLPLALLLGLLALLAMVILPPRRQRPPRLLTVASLITFALSSWPPPARPPSRPAGGALREAPKAAARTPLFFYGLDGADWQYVEPLMARGDLPNLAALRARGAWGPLKSMVPTMSPVIWTTIATGQTSEVHGIEDFTARQILGVDDALPARLRNLRGFGFRALEGLLERGGILHKSPVPSTSRRVPAYWEIATSFGSPVSVVNWWATWPVEPIRGAMVSERAFFWRFAVRGQSSPAVRLVFPPELSPTVEAQVVRPDDVTYEEGRRFLDVTAEEFEAIRTRGFFDGGVESEFKYLFAMHETNRRVVPVVMAWGKKTFGEVPDLLLLERVVDIACHDALWTSELVTNHLKAPPEERKRFSRVVTEAYKSADRALGEYLALFGGEANVIVVSDHGFTLEVGAAPHLRSYNHSRGPDGIFLAKGPAFRPGRVEGLSIFDLLPLLLRLQGFPQAEDLPGRVPREILSDQALARVEGSRIPSYGVRRSTGAWSLPEEMDEEMLERLRALGYLQ